MNHLIVMSLAGELQAVYPHNMNMSFDSMHPRYTSRALRALR